MTHETQTGGNCDDVAKVPRKIVIARLEKQCFAIVLAHLIGGGASECGRQCFRKDVVESSEVPTILKRRGGCFRPLVGGHSDRRRNCQHWKPCLWELANRRSSKVGLWAREGVSLAHRYLNCVQLDDCSHGSSMENHGAVASLLLQGCVDMFDL